MVKEIIDIYTDGSNYADISASWAFIALKDGKELYKESGVLNGEICSIRNIGAELTAIQKAVEWAKNNNYKINIYYDLEGAKLWATGAWRRKNQWTVAYHKYINENRGTINSWKKVKGHSGVEWNERVDELAGETLKSNKIN